MTIILVRKLLRDARYPLFAVMSLLFLFSVLWVKIAQRVTTEIAPFFNGIASVSKLNPKIFEEVLFKGPGRISQAVMGGAQIRFDNPTDFLAVELLHPVVVTLVCLWAVSRTSGAVAGELDRGTLELLLSQPIPRNRLILANFLVDLIVIPLLVVSVAAGTHIGLALVGPFKVDYSALESLKAKLTLPAGPDVLAVDVNGQWRALVNLYLLMFAISGIAIAISSLNRSRFRSIGLTALIILSMFILNVIGQLWDAAAPFRSCSLFFYYQPQKIWLRNDWQSEGMMIPVWLVLAAVGLIGYFWALIVFQRRDLPAPL